MREKQVYCPELDKTFGSLTEAAQFVHRSPGDICNVIRGKRNTCGEIDGVRLHWEYAILDRKEIQRRIAELQAKLDELIELEKSMFEEE